MCDLYSWGVVKFDFPEKNLKAGDVLFLTDAEAGTLGAMLQDCVGHSAIAKYYGVSEDDFYHHEGFESIPAKLYTEIAKGHLKKLTTASDKPFAAKFTWRKNEDGTYSVSADDPYRTISTLGHLAAFEFCRRWLREHYPKEATKIMDLLEKRRVKRSDFENNLHPICLPSQIVDKLLHWHDYPFEETLSQLNSALEQHEGLLDV